MQSDGHGRGAWYDWAMKAGAYRIEVEREKDGRWIAEIPDLPGVMAYGSTEKEAVSAAQALALRVVADRKG